MQTRSPAASILLALAIPAASLFAEATVSLTSVQPAAGAIPATLQNEMDVAINRGLDWLAANQKPDGSWSYGDFPALTALPMLALAQSGQPARADPVARARAYILSCVREDGGIYREVEGRKGGGLSNYNTAICMMALHGLNDPALAPVILKARTFLAGRQHFGADEYSGGFGYDAATQRAYADLLNTYYAAEAMHVTAGMEDQRPAGEAKADIDWAETVRFIERIQNRAEAGPDQDGGLYYKPGESKAGTITNEQGVVYFRAYGSITYAGLLALVYANVDRNDVRVRSAFDWAGRHWSLDENPGMGQRGIYFFLHVLTKCLDTFGMDAVARPDGSTVTWRGEVARRLIDRMVIDPATGRGSWVNADKTDYMESDPVLVTAYSLLALQRLLD